MAISPPPATTNRPTILHDNIIRVEPGQPVNYNSNNPLVRLMQMIETVDFAAEREHYLMDTLQYIFPFRELSFYGPNAPNQDNLDPRTQDFKDDFQKQNVSDFVAEDTYLVRGYATVGDWTGPFLKISYAGGPNSRLSKMAEERGGYQFMAVIYAFIKINGAQATIPIQYNTGNGRYELEIWGCPDSMGDIFNLFSPKGKYSYSIGKLKVDNALIRGSINDFDRDGKDGQRIANIAQGNSMHPLQPLHVELAWTLSGEAFWDSQDGKNYHYEFNMITRGWTSYLEAGISPSPHGGVGFLEYRNLLSNYFGHGSRGELGRDLNEWNLNAYGTKDHGNGREDFMAVDYMDLHILKANCGIGLHRHRDNQEIFFMMNGQGLMVVGDWTKMPQRERCFEVRTLKPGHFAMLKGGNLHGLMNAKDEDASLFMFGGYD